MMGETMPLVRSPQAGFTPSLRSPQAGFTPSLRSPQAGFTLVEMLIALSLFAVVSVAGLMLLRSSISTQAAVTGHLGDLGSLTRLRALLSSELLSAQPRPSRDGGGTVRPALTGSADAISMVFASEGVGSEGGVGRSTYRLVDGALVRDGATHVDGEATGPAATIIRNVSAARWRYRDATGHWADSWSPDRPDRLPRSVELTLQVAGAAPTVMLFLVAPDGLPPPAGEVP